MNILLIGEEEGPIEPPGLLIELLIEALEQHEHRIGMKGWLELEQNCRNTRA